jgi:hypothetical protein
MSVLLYAQTHTLGHEKVINHACEEEDDPKKI